MRHLRNPLPRIAVLMALAFGLRGQSPVKADQPAKPTVDLSIFRHVVHVGWVVKDLDRVLGYWERLGLRNIRRVGIREMPDRIYRGRKTRLVRKMAFGDIGGVQIEWMQPVSGESVNNDFLRQHGDGISHLAYTVATEEQLEEQVRYFRARGVEVVEEGSWPATRGRGRLAYLDTSREGCGIMIELVYQPDREASASSVVDKNEPPFTKIVQYAILARDVKKVAAYYERLGFGGMPIDHNISIDRVYRARPGKYEMFLGWWHWPDVTLEWIQPLVGPSVYDEYLEAHGEGFHHLGFNVDDFDRAVERFQVRGAPPAQTGGWDSPGGKGRFAYLDTEPYGGVTIELLWHQPRAVEKGE